MVRLRLYETLILLPPQTFEGIVYFKHFKVFNEHIHNIIFIFTFS